MGKESTSVGQLFSRVYLERGKPIADSKRFRKRIAAFISGGDLIPTDHIAKNIRIELGVDVPYGLAGYNINEFIEEALIADVLSALTIITRNLKYPGAHKKIWIEFVQRVFDEENIHYKIDEKGGVHYLVDEEFERNRSATLFALEDERYKAVRTAYDSAFAGLDPTNTNSKDALRNIFEAIETLYKIMIGATGSENINKQGIKMHIQPKALNLYGTDETAKRATEKYIESMCDWISAVHDYRHGQNTQEPVQPPTELVIALLASGANYIRWLINIDIETNK
jgi:hypothetical protein